MLRVHAHILLAIVIAGLSAVGCKSSKRTVLYTDPTAKWKLALLPDSSYSLRAVEDFPTEYYTYGRYNIRGSRLRLSSAVPDIVKVNVTQRGSTTSGPRVIHVVDCLGKPLDWRQVSLFLDTVQLLGTGSDYRLPSKPLPSSRLIVHAPPNSISFEAVDIGAYQSDTLTCQVGIPGTLLYPTRPLVVAPQSYTLKVIPSGLTPDSAPINVVNGPAFPTEWRVITKKGDRRTLLRSMPSRSTHSCP